MSGVQTVAVAGSGQQGPEEEEEEVLEGEEEGVLSDEGKFLILVGAAFGSGIHVIIKFHSFILSIKISKSNVL